MTLPMSLQQQTELVQGSVAEHGAVMRRRAFLVFAGALLIYLAFLPPGIYSIDGYSMVMTAESLATRHTFQLPRASREGTGKPIRRGTHCHLCWRYRLWRRR